MEQIFGVIVAIIFGAVFGSYATLFAYRLPLGESCFGRYFGPKSRCPKCNSTIITRDLIPLLNWFFTLGKCRNCQTKIPRIHWFVEFTTTLLFVLCYLKFSFSEEFILYALISVGLVILMATDFTHKIFPQSILIFVLILGLIARVLQEQEIIGIIFSAAIGAVATVIFYKILYKKMPELFSNENQFFDYAKFILIASVCLSQSAFLFYFFVVMAVITLLTFFEVFQKRNPINFGFVLISPFIWLMLNQSLI